MTFVWDPISDQFVSVFPAGGAAPIRQIIHGGAAYDDPIEVAAEDGRLYPIFNEGAAGTLQVILNQQGEVISRTVAEGAYGENEYDGRVKMQKRWQQDRWVTEMFHYDAVGRLERAVTDNAATPSGELASSVDYDLASRKITRTLPGGAQVTE